MSETGRVLRPANENPWYVLMTLYGEQDGEEVDRDLHEKNRAAWNAWACQGMSEEERSKAAASSKISLAELTSWPELQDEIGRLHEVEMRRRVNTDIEYPGLPQVETDVDLSGLAFDYAVVMTGAIFGADARFHFANFSGMAEFNYATFCGKAKFGSATFGGNTRFECTTFCAEVLFGSVAFNDDARFLSASFRRSVSFGSAVFVGTARFASATFRADAKFGSVVFKGSAHFTEVTFGEPDKHCDILFTNCEFEKAANFRDAYFLSSYPDLSGATLNDRTTFTAHPGHWPSDARGNPEKNKASCAAIRHSLGKQGLPEEEHFFFRREMGFAAQIGGWWQRLPYRVFGAVSDFGYSIQRPALWLFGLWLAVAMINHVVLQWEASRQGLDYHVVQAFGLSFANQFPVFGLQGRWFSVRFLQDLNPCLKALGGVQTVLSLPLLFFFALGLRTRFRMR